MIDIQWERITLARTCRRLDRNRRVEPPVEPPDGSLSLSGITGMVHPRFIRTTSRARKIFEKMKWLATVRKLFRFSLGGPPSVRSRALDEHTGKSMHSQCARQAGLKAFGLP